MRWLSRWWIMLPVATAAAFVAGNLAAAAHAVLAAPLAPEQADRLSAGWGLATVLAMVTAAVASPFLARRLARRRPPGAL